ncbi:MAG: sigma 54-interacting transcriptional regulator [bacterium]|nr:sigma 54-interacting transcriptional regulator [bacterium]
MSWFLIVLLAHSLSAALLSILLVSVLRESRRSTAHRAFTGLLAGSLAWLIVNSVSEWLTVSGQPNALLGAFAGVAIQAMTLATFVLCESLPARAEFDAWTQGGKRPARRPLIRIVPVALGCLVLAALSFSPEWISNRRVLADGSTGADYGRWFLATGVWSSLVVAWGLFLLYGKYARESEPRFRSQLALFWTGIAISFVLGLIFSYLLPLAGNSRLFFLGVDSSIALVTLVAYAVLYKGLFDVRTALLRTGLRVIVSLALASAIYAAFLVLFLNRELSEFSIEFALVLSLFFLAVVFFAQRVLPLADRLFVRRPPDLQTVIPSLFRGLYESPDPIPIGTRRGTGVEQRAGDPGGIVETIDRAFPTHRAFVCTAPDGGDPGVLNLHRRATELQLDPATIRFLQRLLSVRELPPAVVADWDRIFVLAEFSDTLPGDTSARYPRVSRVLTTALAALAREDFRIVLPFLFNRRFAGFIALGEKADDYPFFDRDLEYLESLRLSLSVLFQFQRTLSAVETHNREAQQDLGRLTEYLRGPADPANAATRAELAGRTIVYRSPAMRAVAAEIDKIAGPRGDIKDFAEPGEPVLITGETGTGKEIIARMIHSGGEASAEQDKAKTKSAAAAKPFVAVNCAAVAENLWEDELFGHVKGAFTDARDTRAGRVREAEGGVLFFDEIGEMPLEMQAKLLRLLQENVFSPVGSDQTVEARCRFIFATNRSLPEMIQAGQFREDLYYRINVLPVHAPPLRERTEDILLLFRHHLTAAHERRGTTPPEIDPGAAQSLERYAWPGNIRELENLAVRMAALHEAPVITAADLPHAIRSGQKSRPRLLVTEHRVSETDQTLREMIDDYTRRILVETLKKTGGNRTKAAELLGVKRGSLLYRMKELGVE